MQKRSGILTNKDKEPLKHKLGRWLFYFKLKSLMSNKYTNKDKRIKRKVF